MKQLTRAEQYVFAKLALDKLWDEMSEPERKDAETGLKWVRFDGVAAAPKKRGRPCGSKNKSGESEGVFNEKENG